MMVQRENSTDGVMRKLCKQVRLGKPGGRWCTLQGYLAQQEPLPLRPPRTTALIGRPTVRSWGGNLAADGVLLFFFITFKPRVE